VARLGGEIVAMRVAFAFLAALVLGLATAVAARVGGPRAAWFTLPLALFGPFLCWSIVPYQESTFLAITLGALLLWRRWPLAADLLIGLLALVRYEGWPLLLLWVLLRRDARALLAFWGAGLWLLLKATGLVVPFAASPDSFADWQDLGERWSLGRHLELTWKLYATAAAAGLPWQALAGAFGLRRPWSFEFKFIFWALVGQFVALSGWVAALDNASSRMMVLPGVFLGILAARGLARLWEGPLARPRLRVPLLLACAAFTVWSARDGIQDVRLNLRMMKAEVRLVASMRACPGDTWAIKPRVHPGPRRRHDGCEVIQGITTWRAGVDFECTTWGWDWAGPAPGLRATWHPRHDAYDVERLSGEPAPSCAW
jgi:hypothetical protein